MDRLILQKAVPQDARLAMSVVETLREFKDRLQNPSDISGSARLSLDIDSFSRKIDSMIRDLENLASEMSNTTLDEVQNELNQEARDRQQGQNRRMARLEPCEPG